MIKTFFQKNYRFILASGFFLVLLLVIFWPTGLAHAVVGVPLGEQLAPPGKTPNSGHSYNLLIGGWKVCLGLADLFVVLILLFLAAVNIAHINYDTYQLKKSLPLIIIGIVMANFSFLICRMLVSSADILTYTFTHSFTFAGFTGPLGLLYALTNALGLTLIGGVAGVVGGVLTYLGGGIVGIGILLLGLLLIILPFLVIAALWFILWIRVAMIYILIVVAPIAFVSLGFAQTNSIFKQWWCRMIRWTYMMPAIYFVFWIAVKIAYGADATTRDISLAMWVVTLGLSYIALSVPWTFMPSCKDGVMSAWGKGLWKAGKGLGNLAQSGMERKWNWSPRSQIEAAKLGIKRNTDRASTLAIAKARGPQYLQAAKDALAAQEYEEKVGKPLGTSRTAFQRGFKDALLGQTGLDGEKRSGKMDPDVLQGLVGKAQREGMFDDVLDGISDDKDVKSNLLGMAKNRGITLTEDELGSDQIKDNGVRSKILKTLFGTDQEGLRLVNRQQEEATLGGNYTAMDVFWDVEQEKFVDYDRNNDDQLAKMSNIWIKRFQSPDPWKSMPNFRKESFDNNPRIFKTLLEQGIMSQSHVNNLFRARASTIASLTKPENLAVIREVSNGTSAGSGLAKNILEEMVKRKYIPSGSAQKPDVVEISLGDIPIENLAARQAEITPEIQERIMQQIQDRLPTSTPQAQQDVKIKVAASPIFSQDFKNKIGIQADWAGLQANFENVSTRAYTDYAEAQEQVKVNVEQLVNQIKQNLGTAMAAGVNVPVKIHDIVASIPAIKATNSTETLRDQIQNKIREAIKNSPAVIDMGGGQNLTAQRIIQQYETIKARGADANTVKIEFEGHVGGNAQAATKAWEVVKAYLGKETGSNTATLTTSPPTVASDEQEEEEQIMGPEQ